MRPPMWQLLGATSAVICRGLPIGDAPTLVQRNLQVRSQGEDSCQDQNSPELCKKATDWGLCKGWHEGTCLSLKASCGDLKTAPQCQRAKQILGFACRGWGGSSCLAKEDGCRQVTDETACVLGQASLGLECKGWSGKRCLPLLDSAEEAAALAREQQRRDARAKNQAQAKAKEEERLEAERKEWRAQAAERRRVENAKKLLESDEEQRIAAKEAMKQRHQAHLAALKAEEDAKAQAAEDAKRRAEEEAKSRAAEEQMAAEAERRKAAEALAARMSAVEEARRAKFGGALHLRVMDAGGREAELKTRTLNKMRNVMGVARAKLDLPEGTVFTYEDKEIAPDATPEKLGLPDGAVIKAVERPKEVN